MIRVTAAGWRCGGAVIVVVSAVAALPARGDQPQWGERFTRNMVSAETGLVDDFDPETGRNVKWSVPLGTSYATPVISQGRIFIGADNSAPRDDRHRGDRGVLYCLDEADGSFIWQLVVPKLEGDVYLDWPGAGICSPATVEGDRVYVVTNRAEVVALDIEGMANGNTGPFQEEGWHMALRDEPPMEPGPTDADIVWRTDMREAVGMYPHDSAHSSILLHGDYLYLNTGNGVDNTHVNIRAPDAPSLIVLDKHTGRVVAADEERLGPRIFHCTWSSPAMAEVGGRELVFFGGGDGVVYAFAALAPGLSSGPVRGLERAWLFDPDPTAPKENVHEYNRNREVSPSTIQSMPVYHDGRLYVTVGGDMWWGKREAWLKCIDVDGEGEITGTHEAWSYDLNLHSCVTPAVHEGLVFVGDNGRTFHCVDAATGEALWTHQLRGDIWASPLVADGKVYIGCRRGEFAVFEAAAEKRLLAQRNLGDPINAAAVAANGTLYVTTQTTLYALAAE